MDIVAHIRQLLFLHDCVIVPDFGGFVANYHPAEINFAQNSFSPPSKKISFNQRLSGNDGLLIGYISEKQGMGYVDARRVVSEFVKSLRQKLEKGKTCHFEEIGKFFYDKHKTLQFEPGYTTNYLIDSYGLSRMTVSKLESYDLRKEIRKFKDQPPAGQKHMGKAVKRMLIAVPVLVALALIPLKTPYFDKYIRSTSSMNPVESTLVTEDRIQEEPAAIFYDEVPEEVLENSQANPGTEAVEIQESSVVPAAENTQQYFLIAGSFRLEDNALALRSELKASGYDARIHESSEGLFRVSLAGFEEREKAVNEMNRIRKSPGKESIWLMSK